MRRTCLALACVLLPGVAAGQSPETVNVVLSSFHFAPAVIRLHHGSRYVLRLQNAGNGGHNFAAPQFFASSALSPSAPVRNGAVEVGGGETVAITLVAPAPGTYPVRCTHFLHTSFGMKGTIVVD